MSKQLRDSLKKLKIKDLELINGNTVAKELERHAAILADCIMLELDKVYTSYNPKVYRRSYELYHSLQIEKDLWLNISARGSFMSVSLFFDEGAMHKSLFDNSAANTALLINEGYQTHGSFAAIPMFGYREPAHFIEKGIQAYKEKVKNPFKVELTILGRKQEF